MEDQDSLVERNRRKFYETKQSVENKLQEHLVRSRNLLSQVYFSSDTYKQGFTANGKANCSGHFSPLNYISQFETSDEHVCDETTSAHDDTESLPFDGKKSAFAQKNLLGDGMYKTQAAWLLKSSNMTCNLSSSRVDDINIPEILLTDPRDLLLGKDETTMKIDDNDDKLTKLLNCEKDGGKMLNEKSGAKLPMSDVNGTNYMDNRPSFDIMTTLDSAKVVGNENSRENDLLDQILDETCKGLESLTCDYNAVKDGRDFNIADISKNLNIPNMEMSSGNGNDENNITAGFDETLTRKFEENFSKDLGIGNDFLTQALFHISEQDKVKEAAMAPKASVTHEKEEEKERNLEMHQNKQMNGRDVSQALETDLFGSFTIIRDGKFGRKMYRLSDFNHNYHGSTDPNTKSVETQTDESVKTSLQPQEGYIRPNVRVRYLSPGVLQSCSRPDKKETVTKQEVYAKQIIHNRHPQIFKNIMDQKPEYRKKHAVEFNNRGRIYNDIIEKEREDKEKWKLQKRLIYEKIRLNRKSGVRGSMLCRGGKQRFGIVHSTNLIAKGTQDEYSNQFFESPSNRAKENCYGYDDENENITSIKEQKNTKLLPQKLEYPNKQVHAEKSKLFNTISNFDQWWRKNTVKPNLMVNRLSL